ncbi:hypothetical protein Patl1_32336 [Pistacia atlantica]|uniref:Uncharacterized protein n=1 Tax=Pistacia atlantica TaxID=434234 RepID=A0ACC1ARA1_9ROSI|nr:hypothetical protein Patl1_32336 [Pistacia atlantica]
MNNKSYLFLFFLTLSLFSLSLSSSLHNDTNALTLFRLQADTHGSLLSNWTGADACASAWRGVICSLKVNRVVALSLPSLSLRGPITSLSLLDQLRFLDLHENRLNGTILPLTNCTDLKLVYLSGNDFSAQIPPQISSLKRIIRLDLSDNNIRGPIPKEVTNLTQLLTLRLQNNELTGRIPDLSASPPNLQELNLSNNELYGRLPDGLLKKFGQRSFVGNEGLCGSSPLPVCSLTADSAPPDVASTETVPSNPTSMPQTPKLGEDKKKPKNGFSTGAIVAIVLGNCVALLVVTSFVVAYCCRKDRTSSSEKQRRKSGSGYGSEKRVYANGGNDSDGTNATDRKLIIMLKRRNFLFMIIFLMEAYIHFFMGTEDLGEFHWIGRQGSVWFWEQPEDWRGFIKSMNGVACISDFGLSLLLNPVHAIARLGGYRAPEQLEVKRLSQMADVYSFGVLLLEVLTGRAPSQYPSPTHPRVDEEEQAVDLPKWVRSVVKEEWTAEVFDQELLRYKNIEEELVSMLHVGLACVVPLPEKRPTMAEVAKMIEDIRVEQSPLGEEYDESRNSLSPSLATTEDGLAGY